VESLHLVTADGHRLTGDLAPATGTARGAVVVCHPHPQFGGDRFNPVVDAVFRALPPAGYHALRFDFRAAHGHGVDERFDVVAALDELAVRHPALPLHLVGYSFGAAVALATGDARVRTIVAVAPPLTHMTGGTPSVPVLVLAPQHDQFCPPDAALAATAEWPAVVVEPVAMADHFLAGRTAVVAERVVSWLDASS
jgi:hypothetical protein